MSVEYPTGEQNGASQKDTFAHRLYKAAYKEFIVIGGVGMVGGTLYLPLRFDHGPLPLAVIPFTIIIGGIMFSGGMAMKEADEKRNSTS
jgi:hypothetical protein